MSARYPGRPTKYTPELHERIVGYLRSGAFKRHAANACDLHHQTLEQWLRWGEEGREPYAQLAVDCARAMAEDAIRNQMIISKAAAGEHAGDWRAAAWNLERKFPKMYGQMALGHELPQSERPFSPWKVALPEKQLDA